MDIKQLQLLTDIVEAGSLSKVCAARGIAQSALSKHIASLERDFGAKLFYRTGRGVILTEYGQSMLPRVKSLLGEFDQLKAGIRDRAGVPSGPVKLAVQASITHFLVGPLFRKVRSEFPQIELRMMEGFSGSIEEALANGRADIGVLARYGGHRHKTDEELATAELYLVAAAGDPIVSGPEIKFDDVVGLPLVLPGAPDGLRLTLSEAARKLGLKLNVEIEVDSLTAMREIVASGAAYTILTRQAVEVDLALKRVQASRVVEPVLTRTLILATGAQRPLTHAGRTVLDVIRKLTRSLQAVPGPVKLAPKKRAPRRTAGGSS
jgi:LysR family nitrogen assimilation transcriptional regulator